MKNNIFDFIIKSFLMTFGFINIFAYIYISFIRQRLPRDIPYELTEFKLYLLCIICIGYLYSINITLKQKKPNIFFIKLLSLLLKPIISVMTFVKDIKYISKKYISIWFTLTEFLECWSWADNITFIYISQILPRILLLIIFMVDVFYVHKIEVFYYFIFLGISPLAYMIFIIYLENMLEKCIQYLEQMYDQVAIFDANINDVDYDYNPKAIYHDKIVSLRKYLDIQYENFINNDEGIEYEGSSLSSQEHYDEYKKKYKKTSEELTMDDYKILNQEFDDLTPKLLTIKIFLDYSTKEGQKTAYIPEIKLFILCMYLICWLYILIISIPSLENLNITIRILEILTQHSKIPNPFSDMLFFCIVFSQNKKYTTRGTLLKKLFYKMKKLIVYDNINNVQFELGILKLTKEQDTVFLNGKQKHITILSYLEGDKRLAFAILTSTKKGTVLLPDYQPFNLDENHSKLKKQYFAMFNTPLFIENNTYYKPLNSSNVFGQVSQQELGDAYINDPQIKNKIHNNFLTKTLPKIEIDKGYVDVYNGKGVTMADIKNKTHEDCVKKNKKRQAQHDNNLNLQKKASILREAPEEYKNAFTIKKELETQLKTMDEKKMHDKKFFKNKKQ